MVATRIPDSPRKQLAHCKLGPTAGYTVAMATKRTYGDGCAIAHGLDLVGERWALLIVRELLLGPKRFTHLRAGLPNASPNVLADRLRELEEAGVVARRKLPPPAASWVYELTDWGLELEPTVLEFGRWAVRSPAFGNDPEVSADSSILAFRTMFEPDLAGDLDANYELRLGDDVYKVTVADGRLDAGRGSADDPDAVIETDPETLAEVALRGGSLDKALRAGKLTIEGDTAVAKRLLGLFPTPEPAAPAVL